MTKTRVHTDMICIRSLIKSRFPGPNLVLGRNYPNCVARGEVESPGANLALLTILPPPHGRDRLEIRTGLLKLPGTAQVSSLQFGK